MRVCVRAFLVLACLLAVHSTAWAQATHRRRRCKDASGAVLPGVSVEAASPALIEKVRTATTDGSGRYRIQNLTPGLYTVTFTLAGFATVRREMVNVSGTGVITIDGELRVGGVQETITVTGETPVVDVASTTREVTLDNQRCAICRAYELQLSAEHGSRSPDQQQQRQHRPGLRHLPDPWWARRRVPSHGRRDEHQQPAGRQPATELHRRHRQRAGSDDDHVRRPGRVRDCWADDEHRAETGRNSFSGLVAVSGFSKDMQADNFTPELQARGATVPTPVYRVYDFNAAVGGPIVKDRLWYYFSVREQGQRQDTLNVYYNQNAGARSVRLRARFERASVFRSDLGELHPTDHVADIGAP